MHVKILIGFLINASNTIISCLGTELRCLILKPLFQPKLLNKTDILSAIT